MRVGSRACVIALTDAGAAGAFRVRGEGAFVGTAGLTLGPLVPMQSDSAASSFPATADLALPQGPPACLPLWGSITIPAVQPATGAHWPGWPMGEAVKVELSHISNPLTLSGLGLHIDLESVKSP